MNEQQVFILADENLNRVIAQINDDQWALEIPDWFQTGRTQHNMTLRDIVNYHAYDEAWVPDVLAGRTAAEVGTKYDGDLLGDNPKASFAAYVQKAVAAVRGLDDPDKSVHLSYGDFPAREYLKHITSFRGFRSYDIAKLIGADTKLPDGLVQGLWNEIQPEVEDWRKMGVYPAAIEVPQDAPLQDRLLGLVGRQP